MRKNYIDYLRCLAAFAVVCIHVTATLDLKQDTLPKFINNASMWAVPVFIMITGSVSLGKDNLKTEEFIIKKYKRFILPFVFWNAFYFIAYQVVSSQYSLGERFILFMENLYSASHLWYLIMYLFLIPLLPYLNKLVTGGKISKNELLFFSVLILLSFTLMQVKNIWSSFNWINIFNPFVLLVLLGYIVDQHVKNNNLIIIALAGIIILLFGSLIPNDIHFFNYYSVTNSLIALGVFSFFKWLNISKLPRMFKLISDSSFGIYIIHFILIEVINKIWGINFHNFIPIIFIVFTLSFLISWIIGLNSWSKKLC